MRSLEFTLVTARINDYGLTVHLQYIPKTSSIHDIPVLLYSFNDTAYKIVRSLWGSRNSWLGVTWNANQMSPPNFYVLYLFIYFLQTSIIMACRRSFISRRKSILRFRQKLKKPNAYLDIVKGECGL